MVVMVEVVLGENQENSSVSEKYYLVQLVDLRTVVVVVVAFQTGFVSMYNLDSCL